MAFRRLFWGPLRGSFRGCVLGVISVLQHGDWGCGVDGVARMCTFGDLSGVLLAPPPLFLKYFLIFQKIDPHDPKECFVKHQKGTFCETRESLSMVRLRRKGREWLRLAVKSASIDTQNSNPHDPRPHAPQVVMRDPNKQGHPSHDFHGSFGMRPQARP